MPNLSVFSIDARYEGLINAMRLCSWESYNISGSQSEKEPHLPFGQIFFSFGEHNIVISIFENDMGSCQYFEGYKHHVPLHQRLVPGLQNINLTLPSTASEIINDYEIKTGVSTEGREIVIKILGKDHWKVDVSVEFMECLCGGCYIENMAEEAKTIIQECAHKLKGIHDKIILIKKKGVI